MDKRTLWMKYLDGELTHHEKMEAERLLESSPEARQLLEEIRSGKELLLEQLRQLNPEPDTIIPEWSAPEKAHLSKERIYNKIFRWAAILAVPLALFFLVRELADRNMDIPGEKSMIESGQADEKDQQAIPFNAETSLDYAISPNRSWMKKQMVSTEIIINSF
jgi:hypothetical protein